jgi:ribosomal protein L10
MSIKLEKKKELVASLEKALKSAKSVVFVKFDKLKVADANTFRRSLQAEEVGYQVAKKTLLKRALLKSQVIYQKFLVKLLLLMGQIHLLQLEKFLLFKKVTKKMFQSSEEFLMVNI